MRALSKEAVSERKHAAFRGEGTGSLQKSEA
jgi:hypothetical protein